MMGTARERATRSLRMHAPELADVAVLEFGHGLDNVVFVADDLLLRVAEGHSVSREARVLKIIAPRVSVPVPAPRFADEDAGVLAYPLIPGRPLLGRSPPPGTAHRLGRFLRDLHAIAAAAVDDVIPTDGADPGEWLDELDGRRDLLRIVHSTVPRPSHHRVVGHADLGAEHILDLDGSLTGIIDWSDAAITDPALDFARLYRDFGPAFLAEAMDAYGGLDEAMPRIEFFARCSALEDLTYGRASGRSEYAKAAVRSFSWPF